MSEFAVTDRASLQQQYVDGRSLDARSSIYRWQVPQHDLVALVLEQLPADAEVVVDVGCGRGQYLEAFAAGQRAIGIDLSPGLARSSAERAGVPTLVADAAALPLADDSADAATALHMLYHLPQPAAGLRELRRITRPGGTVVVLTNGRDHLAQHRRLLGEAAGFDRPLVSTDAQFAIEDRPLVESVLGATTMVDLRGVITLEHADPLVAYAASAEEFYAPQVAMAWPEFLDRFRGVVEDRIGRDGAIEITTHSALFVRR